MQVNVSTHLDQFSAPVVVVLSSNSCHHLQFCILFPNHLTIHNTNKVNQDPQYNNLKMVAQDNISVALSILECKSGKLKQVEMYVEPLGVVGESPFPAYFDEKFDLASAVPTNTITTVYCVSN